MNTDKQPQTVWITNTEINKLQLLYHYNIFHTIVFEKITNIYLFTPAELEAMKAKWQREAAEKAFQAGEDYGSDCGYNACGGEPITHPTGFIWLRQNYPIPDDLPQLPKQ